MYSLTNSTTSLSRSGSLVDTTSAGNSDNKSISFYNGKVSKKIPPRRQESHSLQAVKETFSVWFGGAPIKTTFDQRTRKEKAAIVTAGMLTAFMILLIPPAWIPAIVLFEISEEMRRENEPQEPLEPQKNNDPQSNFLEFSVGGFSLFGDQFFIRL